MSDFEPAENRSCYCVPSNIMSDLLRSRLECPLNRLASSSQSEFWKVMIKWKGSLLSLESRLNLWKYHVYLIDKIV
jgi:hypothetical protein